MWSKKSRVMLLALVSTAMTGCSSVAYYGQAVKGQADIIIRSRSIEQVLADESTPEAVADSLRRTREILDFASDKLALPDNGSYRRYADLEREHVVWNVFAAEKFSVQPREWCYPVTGCLGYRGYFSQQAAEDFAEKLRQEGHDIHIGGIDAYSTLGKLKDPLLNSFIDYEPEDLAGLLFHELTHQKIYVKDDFVFNESLATAVERRGIELWSAVRNEPERWRRYHKRAAYYEAAINRIMQSRKDLEVLYNDAMDMSEMERRKALEFALLRQDLERLAADRGFTDDWLDGLELNNAWLSSYATYFAYVPGFIGILDEVNNDFDAFFTRVAELAELPMKQRQQLLGTAAQ